MSDDKDHVCRFIDIRGQCCECGACKSLLLPEPVARSVYEVIYAFDWNCSGMPRMERNFDDASKGFRTFLIDCSALALQGKLTSRTFTEELRRYALNCGWKPGPKHNPAEKLTPYAGRGSDYKWSEEDKARFWVMYWSFIGRVHTS